MERNEALFSKLNKTREAIASYTRSVCDLELRFSKTVYQIKSLEQNVKYLTKDGTIPFSDLYKTTLRNLKKLQSSNETLSKLLDKEKEKLENFKKEEAEMLSILNKNIENNVISLNRGE